MLKVEPTANFHNDYIQIPFESDKIESMNQERLTTMTLLNKLPTSKSIKKDKITTHAKDCKAVVFIQKGKQNPTILTPSTRQNNHQSLRSYLRNSKLWKTEQKMKSIQEGVISFINPEAKDFCQIHNFQTEVERTKAISSRHLFGKEEECFETSNDITQVYFNPVIHTIESYMSKKENKKGTDAVRNQQRLSFLSIRNIWGTNQSLNLRGLGPAAGESLGQVERNQMNNNSSQNSLITQERQQNSELGRQSSITGYPTARLSEDMQNLHQHAYLSNPAQSPTNNQPIYDMTQPQSSLYNNNEGARALVMPTQEPYLSRSGSVQQ